MLRGNITHPIVIKAKRASARKRGGLRCLLGTTGAGSTRCRCGLNHSEGELAKVRFEHTVPGRRIGECTPHLWALDKCIDGLIELSKRLTSEEGVVVALTKEDSVRERGEERVLKDQDA